MKRIILFLIIVVSNSCSKIEFKIEPIPNSTIGKAGQRIEYFDVLGSDRLTNKQMIEKLKQHSLQSLNVDSVKAGFYYIRIYYKHSYFSRYNTSKGSEWDAEGTRDIDSPDLFNARDRRIGLVMINNYGAKFDFLSYVDTSTDDCEETDSIFLVKIVQYQSKK